MTDFLGKHEAVVEIIFAVALFVALAISIYVGDKTTATGIIGGILGYMRGATRGSRAAILATPSAPAPGEAPVRLLNEAGFASVRLLGVVFLALLLFALAGCASVTQNITCGETGRDTKQTTTDKTALDGNTATASPNVSLVPK